MTRMGTTVVGFLCTAILWALMATAPSGAQGSSSATVMPYEGQIKSVKIDRCGLQPGSCEGSIVLAQAGGGEEITLAIKPGTWLKRGKQFITIDELGVGNYAKVEALRLPGEPLPRISVLTTP